MTTENNTTINLPLEGMDSEHCALIIDKGLSKVQGIKTHKVELNNNRAIIDTDDTTETVRNAVTAVRELPVQ
jgi:P-type Cu2+ transporter